MFNLRTRGCLIITSESYFKKSTVRVIFTVDGVVMMNKLVYVMEKPNILKILGL